MKIITTFFAGLLFCLILVSASNAQTNNASNKGKKPIKDRPLKVKPGTAPSEYVLRNCRGIREQFLNIGLLVTFDKSGKVTNAELANTSGCKEFDEDCIKAAKRLRFKPEIRNGEAVTVVKPFTFVIRVNGSREY